MITKVRPTSRFAPQKTLVLILALLLIFAFACKDLNSGFEPKVDEKIELKTKLGTNEFQQVSGYFYKNYDSEKKPGVSFHLGNYELYAKDTDGLIEDRAYKKNQVKINFSFKLEDFESFEDLIGEFSSTSDKKVYTFPVIYADNGFVVFDTYTSNGVVEIKEIKSGVATGFIEYTDKNGNEIKGNFTAKAIGDDLEQFEKD